MRSTTVNLLAVAACALAQTTNLTQSLSQSLSNRTDTALFRTLLETFPEVLDEIITEARGSSSTYLNDGVTVLVPDNDAIQSFLAAEEVTPEQLLLDQVRQALSYHVMVKPLRRDDFSDSRGLTVPTLLDGEDNLGISLNLRSPGPELQADFGEEASGQVLFTSLSTTDDIVIRAGEAQDASMTAVDGDWAGGVFQIVNAILNPPRTCSRTVRGFPDILSALDRALNRTELWETLNTSPNVTCLAPDSRAFEEAGNPDIELDVEALTNALLDHVLVGPTYSNHLFDGMRIRTVSNKTVQVALNDSGIWFNDAKVVQPNVLTNNGLLHVLDRVMTVTGNDDDDGDDDSPSPTDSEPGPDATGGGAGNDDDSPASPIAVNGLLMSLVGTAAVVALF